MFARSGRLFELALRMFGIFISTAATRHLDVRCPVSC
jgi:hypothetical protein